MDANGQNLGGVERSREEMLLAEVRRLQSQREILVVAVRRMAESMREQEKREAAESPLVLLHRPKWFAAVEFGEHCLREIEGGAT